MSRRYPKPSIRPERFRLNPYSPLYHELQFAYLGGHGYETKTAVFIDASPYHRHGTYRGYDDYGDPWGYWKALRREFMRARKYPWGQFSKGYAVSVESGYPWSTGAISMSHWVAGTPAPDSWLVFSTIFSTPQQVLGHLCIEQLGENRAGSLRGEIVTIVYGPNWQNNNARTARHMGVNAFPSWTPVHFSSTSLLAGNNVHMSAYTNGSLVHSASGAFTPYSVACKFATGGDMWSHSGNPAHNEFNTSFDGIIADHMIWYRVLSASEHAALADPDNVDLRVPGGPPLILPVRRYWPGFTIQEAPPTAQKVPWHLFTTSA